MLRPGGSALGRPLIDAAFLHDPYPTYRALREAGPIHWSDEFFGGAWLLTRHADVEMVLRDPRLSARRTGGWVMRGRGARADLKAFQAVFARAMLFLDAPDHQRIRRVLDVAFRPTALRQIAPTIEFKLDELLADVDAKSGFDFMQAIARPLPAWVIGTLMGVEPEHQGEFLVWSDGLAAFIGATEPSMEQAHRARECLQAMTDYFEALLPGRRKFPRDDLVSRLVQAEADGRIYAGAELLAQCAMLLFAGHETTRNLLGNGLNALLAHPDQWHQLQAQPSLLQGAVRELLRFDSPVQYTGRRVVSEMVMHGQRLRRGDLVIALIGAANRDPTCFEVPDRLDISRARQGALSFGSGAHVCIGAALTMMEAQYVFGRVSHLWPKLTLMQTQPVWNGNAAYRGLSSLWVAEPRGGVPAH